MTVAIINGKTVSNGSLETRSDIKTNKDVFSNGKAKPKGHSTTYEIQDTNLGHARDLRIITVGAGASGLNLAHQINKHMKNVTHVIYEKNPEVGGTWFENRYPGCACDIPSHNYQFTWEPNPNWNQL